MFAFPFRHASLALHDFKTFHLRLTYTLYLCLYFLPHFHQLYIDQLPKESPQRLLQPTLLNFQEKRATITQPQILQK